MRSLSTNTEYTSDDAATGSATLAACSPPVLAAAPGALAGAAEQALSKQETASDARRERGMYRSSMLMAER
jgi:hypothetical protein